MKPNPYLNRAMIRTVDGFCGRRRELQRVMDSIGTQPPQSVSLVGERRAGKSSLLWHVAHPEVNAGYLRKPDTYVFMMIDFQGQQFSDQAGFCQVFCQHLNQALASRLTLPIAEDLSGMGRGLQLLDEAGLQLICLFDEFEIITSNPVFNTEFFDFLRSMANTHPVAYVTASRRDLKSLCHSREITETTFFNIFTQITIGPIPDDEVLKLIEEPSAAAGMPLAEHAAFLTYLSGPWPFFVQIACAAAFDILVETDGGDLKHRLVEQRFFEETQSHFHYLWEHFFPEERQAFEEILRGAPPAPELMPVLKSLEAYGCLKRVGEVYQPFSATFTRFLMEEEGVGGGEKRSEEPRSAPQKGRGRLFYFALSLGIIALAFLAYYFFVDAESLSLQDFSQNRRLEDSRAAEESRDQGREGENSPRSIDTLHLIDLHLDDIFPSFFSSYANRPLGSIQIVNEASDSLVATLRFDIPEVMREPSEWTLSLGPQSAQVVELTARLDPAVMKITDTVPVRAELALSGEMDAEPFSVRKSQDITLYSRGSLRWDTVARAAAFISSTDPHVAGFTRPLLVAFEEEIKKLGKPFRNLLQAMVLFEALKEYGVRYVVDPNTPYARLAANQSEVDHIQYPAQVLQSKAGDCDDLTVLYAALLENAGIPTTLVDYPGHIFLLFDSGISRHALYQLPIEDQLYELRGDRLLIPVEVTRVSESFAQAWQVGAEILSRLSSLERRQWLVDTEKAWKQFPPTVVPLEAQVQAPERTAFEEAFAQQYNSLQAMVDEYIEKTYLYPLNGDPDDAPLRTQLIKVYLALRQYDAAISTALDGLMDERGDKASMLTQLGIAYFRKGEIQEAGYHFKQAKALRPDDKDIQANLDRALRALGRSATSVPVDTAAGAGTKNSAPEEDVDSFFWPE